MLEKLGRWSTFGRQNTVKSPQPLFAQKVFFPLCITGFSPFMAHYNISLRSWVEGRRVKNSVFHEFQFPLAKKFVSLLQTKFWCYRPSQYLVWTVIPQKLTWCQQFGLQIFPKWGDADIFRLEMVVFRCFLDQISFPAKRSTFTYSMSHIFGKLWHSAIIWPNRKSF